jgi:hypothetical protein
MPRRRVNAGRRTRRAERMARVRADKSAERRAARLEDARLRDRRSRSTASDLRRSQQNERHRSTNVGYGCIRNEPQQRVAKYS